MNVWSKYKLTGLVKSTDAWRVYRAEGEADNRPVLVHLLSEKLDPPRQLATITRVVQASISPTGVLRNALLDFGESKGVHGFVTEDRPEFRDLSSFLAEPAAASSKQEVAEVTKVFTAMRSTPVPNSGEPGEFTRMFSVPSAPTTKAPEAPASELGEFTRMFQVPSASAPAPPAAPATPKFEDVPTQVMPAFQPEPPKPTAQPPGEFTRMFQSPQAAAPPPAQPPPPVPPQPAASTAEGDFTRLFNSPAPPPAAPKPPTQNESALEFERFHRVPVFDPPPPSRTEQLPVNQPGKDAPPDWFLNPKPVDTPVAPQREMSDFTRVFGTRKADSSNPAPSAGPEHVTSMFELGTRAKAGTPGPGAPSEFTQMIQRPQAVAPPQAAPVAPVASTAVEAAPPAKRSMLPIILIVLAVLAVVLIAAVVIVAKKPAVTVPTSVPSQPTLPSKPTLPR